MKKVTLLDLRRYKQVRDRLDICMHETVFQLAEDFCTKTFFLNYFYHTCGWRVKSTHSKGVRDENGNFVKRGYPKLMLH